MIRFFLAMAALLWFCETAWGQSTRPSADVPQPWRDTIASLATAAGGHDSDALHAALPAGCELHSFIGGKDANCDQLLDFLSTQTILGVHTYLDPPATAHSDIDADVQKSSLVPDAMKKSLNLDDKAGNSVAVRWIDEALDLQVGTPVAVIVLWDNRPNLDAWHHLTFILIKGQVNINGYSIVTAVYGDPLD